MKAHDVSKEHAMIRAPIRAGLAPALLAGVVLALAGCGGGGGNDSATAPSSSAAVPDTASQSAASFIAYLKSILGTADDTGEPASVGNVTPPTDDTSEPTAVSTSG